MKKKKEILSDLGQIIIREVYDDGLKFFKELKNNQTKWNIGKEYSDVINKLTENDQEILLKYVEQTIRTTLFGFLGIFEENEETDKFPEIFRALGLDTKGVALEINYLDNFGSLKTQTKFITD